MNVLVTGAAGYIGSIAVERLIAAGHSVVALDNLSRGHRAAIHPKATFVKCDLRDDVAVRATVDRNKVDAIMHFAALTLVGESVEQPAEYYRTNVVGGLNLLEVARECGIQRIVFSSTAAVYGEPDRVPVEEDAPKQPINPYGLTKWTIEQALASYAERYGINYAAFRYFNVAGASEERGEDHHPETHVIPVALFTLLREDQEFTVYGIDYPTPDGTAIRDYVHVVDLADAHVRALSRLEGRSLGPINLGTKTGFSVRQIIGAIEDVTGRQLRTRVGPRRAGDPAVLIADATRAQVLLDWQPHRSTLHHMISTAWAWHCRCPDGYPDG